MATMSAWQYTKIQSGLENSLFLNKSVAAPSKAVPKGKILVEILFAALNPADYKLSETSLIRWLFIKTPATPGHDFCGRVVAVNESEEGIHEGQLVFGALSPLTQPGTLGQLTVVPVSECALLPEGVEEHLAAAVGTAGQTAYQALQLGNIKKGSKLFINGGSGGTGIFGIQFAKILGAQVTTTCSTANVELCRQLGADRVLDYKQVDIISELEKMVEDFDVVVDNVGTPGLYERSHHFLRPEGRFMQVHFNLVAVRRALQPAFLGGGHRRFKIVGVKSNAEDLKQIGQWMEEGKVKPIVEVFEWENVPDAFAKVKSGHTVGKVIIRVARP